MDCTYSDRLKAAAENFLVRTFSEDPILGYQKDDMGVEHATKLPMGWEIDAAMHIACGKIWQVQPQTVNVNAVMVEPEEDLPEPPSDSGY